MISTWKQKYHVQVVEVLQECEIIIKSYYIIYNWFNSLQ